VRCLANRLVVVEGKELAEPVCRGWLTSLL
jgi:hypothetical protein